MPGLLARENQSTIPGISLFLLFRSVDQRVMAELLGHVRTHGSDHDDCNQDWQAVTPRKWNDAQQGKFEEQEHAPALMQKLKRRVRIDHEHARACDNSTI